MLKTILTICVGIGFCIAVGFGKEYDNDYFVAGEIWQITAYCGGSCCCGEFADGITASGHKIKKGDKFVAAPPDTPFGTLLSIKGYANGLPVPVRDRGGAIKGNRIDVFFDTHKKALAWGVQYFEVEK